VLQGGPTSGPAPLSWCGRTHVLGVVERTALCVHTPSEIAAMARGELEEGVHGQLAAPVGGHPRRRLTLDDGRTDIP